MRPPLRPTLLAVATLLALGVGLAIVLGSTGGHSTRGPSPSPSSAREGSTNASGFAGAGLPAGLAAPNWTLTDLGGRRVALSSFRGRVVILAFLSPTASGASPLIAQQIRGALDDLGSPQTAAAVAISANPALDSPARVRAFLARASLTGRLIYLTGTAAQLRPIWRAYHVVPLSAGRARFEAAATVLLIDRRGDERVEFGVEQLTPEGLTHDVAKLRGG
ncbi:MAG: SCO family protein [Solirubrobacterales bacterium]